jgi:hypothetical protein
MNRYAASSELIDGRERYAEIAFEPISLITHLKSEDMPPILYLLIT